MNRLILRELVLGLWKIHILHHAAREGVVGNQLLQELREHGYDASPGTLYPLLHRLEKHGWLRLHAEPETAHAPHTYVATDEGVKVLAIIARHVAELHREISAEYSDS